ncbi:unnamed protein product [Phyllotreta striolata]|uniref:Gamma-aminobutyric acid type B receptor subunit 2 n=1 Tax=Phyllotreta striolata TaxID=444603 RepID=A0A9N9TQT6_PHYSR|nr:unnamed protein product [Phyllotreta striolata]
MPPWQSILLYLAIVSNSVIVIKSQQQKCLNIEEVYPKKYFIKENVAQSLMINIESSTRMTHLLASHIFYIFAKEVLGYTKLNINIHEDNFQILNVMERLSDYSDIRVAIPPATINLEVWTSPEYDTFEKEFVKEVGSVGPPGRFGWFIPKRYYGPIKKFYEDKYLWNDAIQEVHWSFFLNLRLASQFHLDSKILNSLIWKNQYHMKKVNNTWEPICPNVNCTDNMSMYIPKQCLGQNCAILLAPEFEASGFLINQVDEMGVYVNILWLGKNLKTTLRRLNEYYANLGEQQSYFFFHWYPGDVVTDESKFITVQFKNNEFYNFTNNMVNGYKYEMQRLVKMVWSKMEQGAHPLFLGVRHFKLRQQDYAFLLDLVEQGKYNVSEIACEWMKKNKKIWSRWNSTETAVIYIGGIFPLDDRLPFNGAGIVQSAKKAVNYINKHNLIKGYVLNLMIQNGNCQSDAVMSSFLDYLVVKNYYDNLVGVLGPACSETIEPIAAVSNKYRMITISYAAEGVSFADRNKYPYFFRTIGENQHYKHVYLSLFTEFRWKRVAALTEDGQKYTEYISLMSDDLGKNNISFIANKKFPRGRSTEDMRYYLEDLKAKRARIIIADVVDHDARMVICEAWQLQMTAKEGYVWFLPVWLSPDWYNTTKYNATEQIGCSVDQMIEAANGYFSLTHAYFAPDEDMMQENITVGQWKRNMKSIHRPISDYAGFAYDAVWTYALALTQLLQNDSEDMSVLHSANTSRKLVNYIQDVDFHGVSGHIKFRGGSSRVSTINIIQWYDRAKHVVGSFYPNVSQFRPEIHGGQLSLNGTQIKWFTPDGSIPEDGALPPPVCAVEALARVFDVECQTAIIILNVIIAGILLIGVVCVCFYMKARYDRKVQRTRKFMQSLGIPFDKHSPSDLDKWEMARERIVINRKLGEGAFGMVYGGEVELDSGGWSPVAVKTLKVGSTTEDKLDFLSEAEVMKRFEHKNIVKLIGVCTKDEPVYTVMEYMLYGDLKTYLLARRHLVKSKDIDESEEVSPKRLTNVAMDVARGLSYLAEMKFVHRDIASRNCLVNDKRTVKIGDFGMTRAIFDNDYYKFTRRARLPVRWMAPESLALGVFTPSTDVWSFGVLLYEIITFGNFPFQGKTNPEVLMEVKNGQTLQIPKAAKPQLVGLMSSCWKRESKERPTASQIVEFLANNPRLLTPCLDVPILSVQMGDSDELEMPTKNIKVSPSKSANGSSFQAPATVYGDRTDPDNIPLELCCPKEPLLGQGRGSSSNLLSRLGVGSKRESEEDDEYPEQSISQSQDNTNV